MCPETTAIRVHSHAVGGESEYRSRRSLPVCLIDKHAFPQIHFFYWFQKDSSRVIRFQQPVIPAKA